MKKIVLLFVLIISLSNFSYSQWEKCNINKYGILAINNDNIFLVMYGTGIFLSTDNGNSWEDKNQWLTNKDIRTILISDDNIFLGTWGDGILLSSNNGLSWGTMNLGLLAKYITSLAKNGNIIFAGAYSGGISLSTDNGNSWAERNKGLPYYIDMTVETIVIDSNHIFAGTNTKGILQSNDNGNNWELKNNILSNLYIHSLAIKGDYIFAGTDNGMYISTNHGDDWTDKNSGLTSAKIATIEISGNYIFTGTSDSGLFLSSDNGNSWIKKNIGLTNFNIESIATNADYIFIQTGDGVYKAKLSDLTTDINENKKNISNLSISPNPATNNISITYTQYSNQSISIYNSLGIEIKRITENELFGKSSINLTIDDFPSGIYYCTLNSGINKITKSFVVIH